MSTTETLEGPMSASKSPLAGIFLAAFFCVVMVLTVLGFMVRTWMPPVATEHGKGVDFVIFYLLITTGVVFVIGHVALAWLVWKHSRPGPATYRPVSPRVELLWALVPAIFMAAVSEAGVLVLAQPILHQLYGELPEDVVEIEVVGKQFE